MLEHWWMRGYIYIRGSVFEGVVGRWVLVSVNVRALVDVPDVYIWV